MKVRLLAVFIFVAVLYLGLTLAVTAQGAGQGWTQVNTDGFGDQHNRYILALTPFSGQLYAGTYNDSGQGAQLWRTTSSGSWTPVITNGFGITNNVGIVLFPFNDELYAGTWADTGGEAWRSNDGLTWTRVVSQGLGDATNSGLFALAVFSDALYAGTTNSTRGAEIWRTGTGDIGDWTRVITNGFNGDVNNLSVTGMEVFNDYLYAGTCNWNTAAITSTGGEMWRSSDGITWMQVNTGGFGTIQNYQISALAPFNGYLYASTVCYGAGAQVWRCETCDGSDWMKVVDNGFGNADAGAPSALEVFDGHLYFVVGNTTTGMEVWCTSDGTNWRQVGFAGFDDSNNIYPYWDNPVTVFGNRLYIGTVNQVTGGEVWLYLPDKIYLPVVIKQ